MTEAAASSRGRLVGRFDVHAVPAEVAAFRHALGSDAGDTGVPPTYPARWLALSEVRAALLAALDLAAGPTPGEMPQVVLVHLQQRFAYCAPLQAGGRYAMDLYLAPKAQAGGLALTAEILSNERLCCRAQGRFALIPRGSLPLGAPEAPA